MAFLQVNAFTVGNGQKERYSEKSTTILFLYSEDYFLSKSIYDELQSDSIRECSSLSLTAYKDSPTEDKTPLLKENFDLSNWKSIKNLLSEEYKQR